MRSRFVQADRKHRYSERRRAGTLRDHAQDHSGTGRIRKPELSQRHGRQQFEKLRWALPSSATKANATGVGVPRGADHSARSDVATWSRTGRGTGYDGAQGHSADQPSREGRTGIRAPFAVVVIARIIAITAVVRRGVAPIVVRAIAIAAIGAGMIPAITPP